MKKWCAVTCLLYAFSNQHHQLSPILLWGSLQIQRRVGVCRLAYLNLDSEKLWSYKWVILSQIRVSRKQGVVELESKGEKG